MFIAKTNNPHKHTGFTLIELMIVISIMSLVASIVLVATSSAREGARIATALSFSSQIDRVMGDQTAGEWLFNEGSGTAAHDSSGNGNDGILQNGPTWSTDTPDKKSYSLSLDGLNDYIEVADDPLFKYQGQEITLAIWVKPNATEITNGYLISKAWNGSGQYNYSLYYQPSGKLALYLLGATPYSNSNLPSIPVGKWSFVAVTIDSSKKIKVFIDGALKFSDTHTIVSWVPTGGDTNTAMAIGTIFPFGGLWAGNTIYSFDGFIDSPRILNKVLVADQIQQLYAEGAATHSLAIK